MKKMLLILFTALAISCSSDDDNVEVEDNGLHHPYTGSVVGTWRTIWLTDNGQNIGLDCEAEVIAEDNLTFAFYEDGTFDTFHNCSAAAVIHSSGTYTTTGNVLTIIIDGQEGKAHMIDLDEYLGLEAEQLAFRFSIGSGNSLFYGQEFYLEKQ